MLFLLHQFKNKRVLIDNGTGNSRKIIDMSSTNLKQLQRQELTGVHAFSGNDYVSRFFRKGKKNFGTCWQSMKDLFRYLQTWACLTMLWRKRNKKNLFVWFMLTRNVKAWTSCEQKFFTRNSRSRQLSSWLCYHHAHAIWNSTPGTRIMWQTCI